MAGEALRVCHIVNKVGPTSVPADIARGLAKHTGVEVGILAWFDHDPFEGKELIDVHALRAPDTTLGIDFETFRRADNVLSEYDVVQTHHNHSGFYAKLIAAFRGIPIVSTEQNNHDGFTTRGLVANALTNPLAKRVTCVSPTVADSFGWWERLLLREHRIEVIYNGVDLERVENALTDEWTIRAHADLDPEAFVVGSAGMFTEQKALDVLIKAIAEVSDPNNGLEAELVIAGDGDQAEALSSLCEQLGVVDRVHFLGLLPREQVYKMMSEVDAYVMPSRWEGFSAAAVEALSVGAPCVFSNIDEFTRPFEDAAMFHEVDDVDSLAGCIRALAEDEVCRKELGERGRERAKKFSLQSIAGQYRDLYSEIV